MRVCVLAIPLCVQSVLISASYDNSIKVWVKEAADDDWFCTQTLNEHTSTVWSVSFNVDGTCMVSCSDDKSVVVWSCTAQNSSATATSIVDENIDTSSSAIVDKNITSIARREHGAWYVEKVLQGAHSQCIYSVDWSREGIIESGVQMILFAYSEVGIRVHLQVFVL